MLAQCCTFSHDGADVFCSAWRLGWSVMRHHFPIGALLLALLASRVDSSHPVTMQLKRIDRSPHSHLRLRGGLSALSMPRFSASRRAAALQYGQHFFTVDVVLGDGHTLAALVDTGSGSLAVSSGSCAALGCQGHKRFRPEEDESGHFLGAAFSDMSLHFASGRISGSGFESRICMSDGSCGRTRFLVASWESSDFRSYRFDAVLGLGPPQQAIGEGFNILSAFVQQGVLPVPAFALSLRSQGNSTLTLGTTDAPEGTASQLQWLPTDTVHGEWALILEDASLDGSAVGLCGGQTCRAVLDSGCPGIAVPERVARHLNAKLQLGDCSTLSQLPRLSFHVGNRSYEVGPERYVEVSKIDASKCRLLIQANAKDLTRTVILGHPFLLDRYVVFDQGHMRIGLADAFPAVAPEVSRRV